MMGPDDINRANVARLTDKQRECMHLVVMRKSSKEIARELRIAKPTVDQRIASARQILGARNRDEAALIFARATQIYDRVIYDPARIPDSPASADMSPQEMQPRVGLVLEEPATIPFSGVFEHQRIARPYFPWGNFDDIGTEFRLLIIAGLTLGILMIVLIGLAVAQSISGLLTAP
jgi:DNA-binding CsgD family transcriptional regulator